MKMHPNRQLSNLISSFLFPLRFPTLQMQKTTTCYTRPLQVELFLCYIKQKSIRWFNFHDFCIFFGDVIATEGSVRFTLLTQIALLAEWSKALRSGRSLL